MPERRGVIFLYCGAVGVVGADIEDVGTLGAKALLIFSSLRRGCLGAVGAMVQGVCAAEIVLLCYCVLRTRLSVDRGRSKNKWRSSI